MLNKVLKVKARMAVWVSPLMCTAESTVAPEWAFCRHNGMQKHKTQYRKNAAIEYTVEYQLFILMITWLTLSDSLWPLPSIDRVSQGIALALEETKIQTTVSTQLYCFCTIVKLKNRMTNHH